MGDVGEIYKKRVYENIPNKHHHASDATRWFHACKIELPHREEREKIEKTKRSMEHGPSSQSKFRSTHA